MSLVLVVLPLLLFVLVFAAGLASEEQLERSANGRSFFVLPVVAAVLAALAGLFTLLPMRSPMPWVDHAQVAWTGLRAQKGLTLQIGSDARAQAAGDDQSIGWPGDFHLPALKLAATGSGALAATAFGGEGFIRQETTHALLNGEPLRGTFHQTWPAGSPESNRFALSYDLCQPSSWFRAKRFCLTIAVDDVPLTAGDEAVLRFPDEREHAVRLSNYVKATVQRLRHTPGQGADSEHRDADRDGMAAQAGALERWAATVVLLPRCLRCAQAAPQPELYFLTQESAPAATQSIPSGTRLDVLWPGVTLKADAVLDPAGRVSLSFLPPYRHSTPLPPGGSRKLLIESRLAPGDTAFLLPLPASAAPVELSLDPPHGLQSHIKAGPRGQEPLRVPIAPLGVEALFQEIHAIPIAFWPLFDANGQCSLAVLMIWAWLSLLGGLAVLAFGQAAARQKICCTGLVLALWTILCVRFLLAFRFALDPAHLDSFSVDQMHEALDALCLGPALVAFCCNILRRGRASRAAMLALLAWLPVLAIDGLLLLPSLWRSLHLPFAQASLFNASTMTFAGAIAVVVALGYGLRRARSSRRPTPSIVEQVIDAQASLGAPYTFVLAGVLSLATVLGYYGSRVAPLSLRSLAKEVLLVLLQYIVVRYGVECLEAGSPRVSKLWKRWPLLNWALLVLFVFIVAPPALDDVGGIFAGCGLLVPFTLLGLVVLRRSPGSLTRARGVVWVVVGTFLSLLLLVVAILKTPLGDFVRQHTPATARITHWLSDYAQGGELGVSSANNHGKRSEEQELAETDEQTWQNKAMIVLGDANGVGYGNAPSRRSSIPQDTLQSDSTYSFFVASEFGRMGGVALILLFAAPLFLVLLCAQAGALGQTRTRMAMLLVSAFLVECLVHIAMNMEIFPMTGRSMPLLSTHSLANTMRWLMLFGIAGALLSSERDDPTSALRNSWAARPVFALASLAMLALTLYGGMASWTHHQEVEAFRRIEVRNGAALASTAPTPDQLRSAALLFSRSDYMQEAALAVSGETPLLSADSHARLHSTGLLPPERFAAMKLGEEVQRFNGLPDSLRMPSESEKASLGTQLQRLGPEAYMQALLADTWRDLSGSATVPPALFRVDHEIYADLDHTHINAAPPTILINPAFQNVLDLRLRDKAEIATLSYADAHASLWRVSMMGSLAEFTLQAGAPGRVPFDLDATDGTLTPPRQGARTASTVTVRLSHCAEKAHHTSPQAEQVATFVVDSEGRLTVRENMPIAWVSYDGGKTSPHAADHSRIVEDGDRGTARTAACGLPAKLSFAVQKDAAASQLAGPAWSEGQWRAVVRPASELPWLPGIARALQSAPVRQTLPPAGRHPDYALTLDPTLERLTTQFLDSHAIDHFYTRGRSGGVPPRAGITVLDLATGEVLAMAGWPRASGTDLPRSRSVAQRLDVQPPERWLESFAPAEVRNYFLGERNFDALPVGSATKPIWAAASLATNSALSNLQTRNPDQPEESELFGIDLGKPWGVHQHAHPCCNLNTYLAFSDNRFHTRLNFAALADLGPDGRMLLQHGPSQPSPVTSLDGHTWGGVPDLGGVHFGYVNGIQTPSTTLQNLDNAAMPKWLAAAFPAEVISGSPRSRSLSFWTGREQDNGTSGGLAYLLSGFSPVRTQLDLDRVPNAREFINILLGGSTNRWTNVDLPSAFYTALTGRPLVPHLLRLDPQQTQPAREAALPPAVPCLLRKGLRGVVRDPGATATAYMARTVDRYHDRYEFYAKSGTLDVRDEGLNMSRIVFALVNPSPHGCPGDVQSGLLFSVFVEQAPEGTATQWLNDFLSGTLGEDEVRAAQLNDLMRRAHDRQPR